MLRVVCASFCSQVGRAFGGDFDCNGCAHVCLGEPIHWCESMEDQCAV